MQKVLILIIALAVLGGCGSGDSEPSLSESITETTWLTDQGKFTEYHDDGNFGVSTRQFDDVTAANREWGVWSLDGNILTVTPDAESPYCAEVTGTYELELVDDGNRIEATVQDDACDPRRADFTLGLTKHTTDN